MLNNIHLYEPEQITKMFNLLFIISRTIDSRFYDLVVSFIDDRTLLYFFYCDCRAEPFVKIM